MPVTQVLIKGE